MEFHALLNKDTDLHHMVYSADMFGEFNKMHVYLWDTIQVSYHQFVWESYVITN
jgi:hypothetical protein